MDDVELDPEAIDILELLAMAEALAEHPLPIEAALMDEIGAVLSDKDGEDV